MSFIRPDALATLLRWREALIGGGLALLGGWIALTGLGPLRWLAGAVAVAGLALLWEGFRRARFRPGTGGPGLVEVDERQITYFGPERGGVVSLDALARVSILTPGHPGTEAAAQWIFEEEEGAVLAIPAAAAGADALFDAIAALPGADYDAVLAAMRTEARDQHLVWEKGPRRLH